MLGTLGPQKSFYTRDYWYIFVALGVTGCGCAPQDKAKCIVIVIAITKKNEFATKMHLESLVLMELKGDPQKIQILCIPK